MALDVYVGTLTRYYTRDWENVVQREARLTGREYHVISPGGDQAPPPRAEDVTRAVAAWQDALTKGLGDALDKPAKWDESSDTPYFTDRPGYPGYSGLLTWAVYAHNPDAVRPSTVPEDWGDDKLFQAAVEEGSGNPYRQILQPELWLPTPFDFVFRGPSPTNEPISVGSSAGLLKQLALLNEVTFAASDAQIERYLAEEIDADSELEHAAKFTFAVFQSLAQKSVENNVPMLLDI